jgi:hypothetical protein
MTIESIRRLRQDLMAASKVMTDEEAKYLVRQYYLWQELRIGSQAQLRSLEDKPNSTISWLWDEQATMEELAKEFLDKYTMANPIGRWMRSIDGIGPVIAACILANVDITKAQTAGAIWRYAGLDPDVKWGKGEKRPWNADLKVACWKLGESFVKVSGKEDAYYGQLYKERKILETTRNEAGEFAQQAAAQLAAKKFGEDTDARKHLEAGRLPPAHIHARAKRYAVKMFLSHLHHVWFKHHFRKDPPMPFAIAHLNHVHMIDPPEFKEAA